MVLSHDFEDGTSQGWRPRAGETVTVTAEAARTGGFGLAVSDRTQSWEGPTLDLVDTLEFGTRYDLSVWVRMAAGEPASDLRMSVERVSGDSQHFETVVGNTTVTSGSWVQLAGSYTLATAAESLSVYVESASGTADFYIDDFELSFVPPLPIEEDIPNLRDVLADHFPIGAAVEHPQIIGRHADLLVKHFNSITPGNYLKWDATQPVEGQFRFDDADAVIDFARDHGMQVRGHTLVWHNQTPEWVFQDAAGNPLTSSPEHKALLLQRLEDHIRAVAGRYADDIVAWDVVNEVIDENEPDGLRRSRWYEIAGLDYIRTAFRVAREAAPAAKLFINDYNTNVPAKREALYNLVSQLLAEGVPIDGVGHQMHINIDWPSVSETEQMLQRFIPLGVEQQITEMDISIYTDASQSFPEPPRDRLITQGHRYHEMFDLYRQYDDEITSVTLWGLADDDTWLDSFPVTRKDAPLLFDVQLQAKPAYWGIVDPRYIEQPPSPSPSASPTSPAPTPSPSASPSPTPSSGPSQPASECRVAYRLINEWPGGFQAEVALTNSGATSLDGWELRWSFPSGQQVTQLWNGRHTQSGAQVVVTNESWNGVVPAGGTVVFGFLGSWQGTNAAPDTFTVNDTACTTG